MSTSQLNLPTMRSIHKHADLLPTTHTRPTLPRTLTLLPQRRTHINFRGPTSKLRESQPPSPQPLRLLPVPLTQQTLSSPLRCQAVSEDSPPATKATSEPASPSNPSPDAATATATATATTTATKTQYQNTPLDDFFLMMFRRKLVKETGWRSPKQGYDGMIEEAKKLLVMSPDRTVAEEAAVRILLSFFPPGLLPLFKKFLAPGFNGKLGPILSAVVTLVTCQWLMGESKASEVELPDGTKLKSGVKIEKCRFLEETKCAGSCIHTCKIPTQAFMEKHMGVPLYMEPNFEDFSCEFKFGVPAPKREDDELLRKPCLAVCPVASARPVAAVTCPEVLA